VGLHVPVSVKEPMKDSGGERAASFNFDESLVVAFERAAERFSSRIALGSDVWEPTYRELNETANRLAHRLIASKAAIGDRAVILMSFDAPLIAGVLGILKAGLVVVPLNPDEPVARLKKLVEDAEPSVILADSQNWRLATEILRPGCQIIAFECEKRLESVDNPSIAIAPGQTAFLGYTSGTTGRPKGVMKTHRQLLRGAAVHTEAMRYTENDRIPLFAMISTGQGAIAIWHLLTGATLCPFPIREKGVIGLERWIIDRGLTVYVSSASIFRTLVKSIDEQLVFSDIRAVRLASEATTAADFRAFQKHFPPTSFLVHGLSSSETSNIAWSRWAHSDVVPEGVLPIGHVSADLMLLHDDGDPVARGEIGEIVIKSRYVANGYWRNPELTAQRFSADLDGTGTRLVKTGDLARMNANGFLEFCGREDDRIKLRGNRIELGDIERTIASLPGIDRAAVIAVRHENREPVLVAFVLKTGTSSWTVQQLRRAIRENLPQAMVPSRILFLESFPYNRGNKIDREALRQHALYIPTESTGDEARTETEILLADIWADVLEVPDVRRGADFFNLGGDSLKGAIVAAQLHATLGIELHLGTIADHPTIATLAAFIDQIRQTDTVKVPPLVRAPRGPSMPMSFNQEAMWNFCRGPEGMYVHTNRIIGPLNVEIFENCLNYLSDRHEILRTTFDLVEGRPAQIIHQSAPSGFKYIDLINAENPERDADSIFGKESARENDLTKLPIKRDVLVRVAPENYRLLRISHLLISDGFSARLLEAELAKLYEARLEGREPPLTRKARLQYADYAVWQRAVMKSGSPGAEEALEWWTNILSSPVPATRLPFRRLISRGGADPNEGVFGWQTDEQASKRLDQIARGAGATYFMVRLAAFVALLADVTGNSTVVIGTYLDNRNSIDVQSIVGRLLTTATMVFSYDPSRTFAEWTGIVRDRVFEMIARNDPASQERLRSSGLKVPEFQVIFMMSSHHADQHFGDLKISDETPLMSSMPKGCTVYVDEQKPQNCRVMFDASHYDQKDMRAMLGRYVRLLEIAALRPELPVGILLTTAGANPRHWTYANYAAPFFEFIRGLYVGSPLMRMLWKPVKTFLKAYG
jgi:amino acid adenylation domain-containing protein